MRQKKFKHGDLVKITGGRIYNNSENSLILKVKGELFIVGSALYSELEFEEDLCLINSLNKLTYLNKLKDVLEEYTVEKTGEYSNIKEFEFLKNLGHSISPCGEMISFKNLEYKYPIYFKKIGRFVFLSNSNEDISYNCFCYIKHLLQCPLIAHLPLDEDYEETIDHYEKIGFKLIDSYINANSGNQVNVYVFS